MEITTPSFGRSGRPRKIKLSDLFLWDPMLEFELTGMPMTELMGQAGPEMVAIYQDMGRRKKISAKRARSVIPAALEAVGFPYAEELSQAFDGQESRFDNLGPWETLVYAFSTKIGEPWPPKVSLIGKHLIELERALVEPTAAWRNQDMTRCVDLIEASPVLSDYLWPEALAKLREGNETQIAEVRYFVLLEMMLSRLAAQDAQKRVEGRAGDSLFDRLFPDFGNEKITQPNALFFAWLAEFSGVKKELVKYVSQVTKREKDADIESARRQLRKWKSGSGFPSNDVLDALFSNLFGDHSRDENDPRHKDMQLSWAMAMATRRVNFLVPLLRLLRLVKAPVLPFGYSTIQEWRANRYSYWYSHWLANLGTT